MFSDQVLFITLTDNDAEISLRMYYTNIVLQFVNGLLINSIVMAYNAFVFLWFVLIIYQVRTISALLEALKGQPNDSEWTRKILIECHRIHVDVML